MVYFKVPGDILRKALALAEAAGDESQARGIAVNLEKLNQPSR